MYVTFKRARVYVHTHLCAHVSFWCGEGEGGKELEPTKLIRFAFLILLLLNKKKTCVYHTKSSQTDIDQSRSRYVTLCMFKYDMAVMAMVRQFKRKKKRERERERVGVSAYTRILSEFLRVCYFIYLFYFFVYSKEIARRQRW